MMKFFRDVVLVARNELADSIRSRQAALVLLLYVAGALLICNGFITALHGIEKELSKALALPEAATPGAVMDTLWRSERFQHMARGLVGDRQIAEELMTVHPMALIYGWLVFVATPLLVMLTASPRIADESGTGSIRFVRVRTSPAAWCLGKYAGQALMTVLALTVSAVCAWALTRFRLVGMNSLSVAQGMVIYSWKAWLYSLAFVGLALGVSQLTHSAIKATVIGCGVWASFTALGFVAAHFVKKDASTTWEAVLMLLPSGHRLDLWRAGTTYQVQAVTFLLCLGLVYLFIGQAVAARRDA